ncbi:peptidoglycan DD-metalloendopeptidase family protein [Candidatus Peregrinibacteria bacterium]|nr:peptidoglycan DD-metalloendopeptidase family protein [Candidatus Peregrinibacteria bacterium]
MKASFFQKHRKTASLLILLNFVFVSSAFGQMIPSEVLSQDEADIFPFSHLDFEETDPFEDNSEERTVDYSEDLYEITDEGIYDSEGYFLDPVSIEEANLPEETVTSAQDAFEAYKESIISNWGGKRAFTESRLEGIRSNLNTEKDRFTQLEKEIGELKEKLEPLQQKIESLKDQINLLNHQLVETKNKITNAEIQIADKEILLRDLMWDLKQSETELNIQRNIVLQYILLVYQEEEKFFDYYDESSSTLKLLLADNSMSENLLGKEYLEVLEEAGREVFYELHDKKVALEEKRDKVNEEREKLDELYRSLAQEQQILEEGRQSKKDLLEETMGEEERYQQLLEESIQQQLESAIAIQNMQDNIQFIEEKLELLDDSLEKVENLSPDSESVETLEQFQQEVIDESGTDADEEGAAVREYAFSWPVPPLAITAYFHDPTYPKKWGVHQAIDIRAKQYTEIRAPANGYVFQTKDNGMGYSYIILAHKNKFVTVYGHVSEIRVKAGTVVKEGDVIGLSGGTPGTKGAGWQTTGPHLHFEVWHEGSQADPLDFLPVFDLPIEYIPDRFLENLPH